MAMTKTSRSAKTDHVLDDAKNLLAVARRYQKHFTAADKGKRSVRVGPTLLNTLAANLSTFERARDGVAASKKAKEGATAVEVKARIPLYETLIDIRDDVVTTHRGDKVIAKAFGVGVKISRNSTPLLLKAAGDILSVVKANKAFAKAASEAGVNAARLAQLKRTYDALAQAQQGQVSAISSARAGGDGRKSLQRAITGDVAFIRKVASGRVNGATYLGTRFRKSPVE